VKKAARFCSSLLATAGAAVAPPSLSARPRSVGAAGGMLLGEEAQVVVNAPAGGGGV